MLLNPERIFGWNAFTYVVIAAVAVFAFVLAFRRKKQKRADLYALIVLAVLIVLSEIALSLQLGGTDLFFLEWTAYFGELLIFLPVFAGYLLGFLIKTIFAKEKLNEVH